MKNAKPRLEAGFRENGVATGFSGVFAKPHNAAKSGALEQESYVSGSSVHYARAGSSPASRTMLGVHNASEL